MNFPFYIARRYLFAKKSHNAINIITLVAVIGVAIGTMALIIVLSVFNGFEKLILSLFNAFNPDLEITLREGKAFAAEELPLEELGQIPGVVVYSQVLEETALLTYRDRQHLITMRGVDDSFRQASGIDTMMVEGEYILMDGDADYFILGQGVAYMLGANINDFLNPISLYIPQRGPTVALNPAQAFNATSGYSTGIFGIQAEFDMEYALVPLRLARQMLGYTNEVTSIMIRIDSQASASRIHRQVEQLVGERFEVKDRLQQQDMLYKIMQSEKWAIFLILSFILVIAAFNVTGSLTMLVIEKDADISILRSMGASSRTISHIFLAEGLMISLGGALSGIILGSLIAWIQMQFGVISIQAEGTFIVDSYPVHVQALDIVLVGITVFVIGLLASLVPLRRIARMEQKAM
ncbi:MAG: FtsX-like permease family protein [Bacteroidales bacterium]